MRAIAWIEGHPDQFQSWLVEKRWFGDKSRSIVSVEVTDAATVAIDDAEVSHVQAKISYDDGGEATYFVPLLATEEGQPRDALESSAYLGWLGAGFDAGRVVPLGGDLNGRIRWHGSAGAAGSGWAELPARVLSGEQSNTSVLYGDRSIVKVFRKLQAGINPDSEIVSYLTDKAAFVHVPRFEGAVVMERGDGEQIELATAQAFVPNDGDCWRWLPGALVAFFDEGGEPLLDAIGLLGQRTGELHVALGQGTGEAFEPEAFLDRDVIDLEARLSREVHLTASMLFRQGELSHGDSESLAAGLLAGTMQADSLIGSQRTRVHGDYHLGQVLKTGDDFAIIDFEGEPSRTMNERREKHSPLKDVAGMLRSIDYAVASAYLEVMPKSRPKLQSWGVDAAARFTAEYLAAVRAGGGAFLPGSDADFARSLDLFVIDKALYEVRYELDNRPDWLHIPLGALQKIAQSD